jgi:hypothetical protein
VTRKKTFAALVTIALAAGVAAGCDRGEGEEDAGLRDTLAVDLPENIDESMEQGARRLGGRVGEALEETGEAIEEAGERIQEEAGEPVMGDTTRM